MADETLTQADFALRLRAAIDTARKYPTVRNTHTAVSLAQSQPDTLRSRHVQHNLGTTRWDWLTENGIFAAGDAGQDGSIKGTIEPEIKT